MSVDSSALHAAVSLACSDPRARPSAGRVRPQSVRVDSDSRRRANKSLTVGASVVAVAGGGSSLARAVYAWRLAWSARWSEREKHRSQCRQRKGFAPVCLR